MKPKSKSSKIVRKKTLSKKKVTSTTRKKKVAVKSLTKAKNKIKKGVPKKRVKKTVVKKKIAAKAKKRKTGIKPVKKRFVIKKPVASEPSGPMNGETVVSFTSITLLEENPLEAPPDLLLGKVIQYFDQSMAAVIELETGPLQVGDIIQIQGDTTDFEQAVETIQLNDQLVESAEPGETIVIAVRDLVREDDKVYKKE